MRELTAHIVEGDAANHQLKIEVTDQPGAGGANHRYEISGFSTQTNPSELDGSISMNCTVLFQNGPIEKAGVNGITQEALLAILIDRLEGFQAGKFACEENAMALTHLQLALANLQIRTGRLRALTRFNREVCLMRFIFKIESITQNSDGWNCMANTVDGSGERDFRGFAQFPLTKGQATELLVGSLLEFNVSPFTPLPAELPEVESADKPAVSFEVGHLMKERSDDDMPF